MADPLSFVASIIAVSSLADKISSKGYKYLRAVREAPQEVRKLFAEVEVLCGVLDRLELVLRRHKRAEKTQTLVLRPKSHSEHQQHQSDSMECDDEESDSSANGNEDETIDDLEPPIFIIECRKTLSAIDTILNKFHRKTNENSQTSTTITRMRLSKLRRLSKKDLKWPLARSETMELVEALERHKNTCALAIACDGLTGVHSVLENVKISNQYLRSIDEKQTVMYESHVTEEQERILAWLSPVNPYSKLETFRRGRQSGTGVWLFDLPEMEKWLTTRNDALWIYGIPGAGKTILSTLVVDKVLSSEQSKSVGTAFFYIRHDDSSSHIVRNVLGSLISQLGYQNPFLMEHITHFYREHRSSSAIRTEPTDLELLRLLCQLTNFFTDTYIMIDGLDECGSLFDDNRKRLIQAVAKLHCEEGSTIRTLVFSRDESDIRACFQGILSIPIAAVSSDLQLYIHAWLPSLRLKSKRLETEISEALIAKANGMFMWVRAQIDYLQRLPTSKEKRDALQDLPPDLPKTYIRIFEQIDSNYPEKTKKYIIRALKWLVFVDGIPPLGFSHSGFDSSKPIFSDICLCHAVCFEQGEALPTIEDTPSISDFQRWLGCLIHVTDIPNLESTDKPMYSNLIEGVVNTEMKFSHFTVKEFLSMSPEEIASPTVHKYLLNKSDFKKLVATSLDYLNHDTFKFAFQRASLDHLPLYDYIARMLFDFTWNSKVGEDIYEDSYALDQFLSSPISPQFRLWNRHILREGETHWLRKKDCEGYHKALLSPLHVAAMINSTSHVQKLLYDKVDPDTGGELITLAATPLHLAIWASGGNEPCFSETACGSVLLGFYPSENSHDSFGSIRFHKLAIATDLTRYGADINAPVLILNKYHTRRNVFWSGFFVVTPLVLSVLCDNPDIAEFLISKGATCKASSLQKPYRGGRYRRGTVSKAVHVKREGGNMLFHDIVSLEDLPNISHASRKLDHTLQRIIDIIPNEGLKKSMKQRLDQNISIRESRPWLNSAGDQRKTHFSRRSQDALTWALEILNEQGIRECGDGCGHFGCT